MIEIAVESNISCPNSNPSGFSIYLLFGIRAHVIPGCSVRGERFEGLGEFLPRVFALHFLPCTMYNQCLVIILGRLGGPKLRGSLWEAEHSFGAFLLLLVCPCGDEELHIHPPCGNYLSFLPLWSGIRVVVSVFVHGG